MIGLTFISRCVCGMDLVYAAINGGMVLNKMVGSRSNFLNMRQRSLQNRRRTSNAACIMESMWELGLREYKSHVNKGLEFLISVKLLILVTNVSHCQWRDCAQLQQLIETPNRSVVMTTNKRVNQS